MNKSRPDQAPPLAPSTFALAFVTAVEQGEASTDAAAGGNVAQATSERALFALRRLFPSDETATRAAWLRFNALMNLHAQGALGYWQRDHDGGKSQFHPAVLDAASQLRLSRNGRFAKRKFLDAVAEIAAAHYAGFEAWPLPRAAPPSVNAADEPATSAVASTQTQGASELCRGSRRRE